MKITDEVLREEFEAITRPVIEWLNENCNSHTTITIDIVSSVLNEGTLTYETEDYLKD